MARRRNNIAPRESLIQQAVIDHWKLLGEPNTLVAAIPNQKAFGQPGLTKGLPDLLVMGPRVPGHCHAGFLELKRDRRSPVTEDQKNFARLCLDLGIAIAIAYGRDEPIRVLEDWGVVRPARAAA